MDTEEYRKQLTTLTDEELVEMGKDLTSKISAQNDDVLKKINDVLTVINTTGQDVVCSQSIYIRRAYSSYNDEKFGPYPAEIQVEIGFKSPDSTRYMDFGSTFTMEIYANYIKINKGTCGSYTREYIFQVARDHLLHSVWVNENLFTNIAKFVDISLLDKLHMIIEEEDYRKCIKKQAEEDAKRAEFIKQLKSNKYVIDVIERYDYDTANYVKSYSYASVIKKVTDKSVILMDCDQHGVEYSYRSKRIVPIGRIINDLDKKSKVLSNKILSGKVPE